MTNESKSNEASGSTQPATATSASGPRFCPRCGTSRVGDLPFCPRCGLKVTDPGNDVAFRGEGVTPVKAPPSAGGVAITPGAGGLRIPPLAIIVAVVVIGLLVLGLLPRPQIGGGTAPAGQPGAAASAPAAPITGLTILSPTDGQTVATKDVIVIGTAPPGLSITQDVSFGLDQHATTDGTGHWAIKVGLKNGDNKLSFRIGDDHSTERTIRVIYTPPAGG